MLARAQSNRNSHSSLVKMQNGVATLEDNLPVSYKAAHILTVKSNNQTPWYLPKLYEKLCPYKNLYTAV